MHIDSWRKLYDKVSRKVLAKHRARHFESSLICSLGDVDPSDFLIELMAKAIPIAWEEKITGVNLHLQDSAYINRFPGEHYRILKAITMVLNPKLIVEIGTYTGMGTKALIQGQGSGVVYTYDLLPWVSFATHLNQTDFDSGRVIQKLGDLSDQDQFNQNFEILNQADIIFIDAPKDGVFEYRFLELLKKLGPKENRLLIIDDIRFINMIDLWIDIESPKLDITSFGHWSGTGLVDVSNPLRMES